MAVNKIIYNKKTLIDLTNDTVTADKLFKGVLAHDKSGNQIVGTFEQSLPTGTKTITANGTYDVTDYATAKVNVPVPSGYVKPSGTKYITTTSSVDVTSYAKAQISSSTLIAENIKKDVSILGVTGTYEGSGGGGIEYEIITIPAGAASATYSLKRVTNAIGSISKSYDETDARGMINIVDTMAQLVAPLGGGYNRAEIYYDRDQIYYDKGTIHWSFNETPIDDITLILVNDPSKDVLYTCTPS